MDVAGRTPHPNYLNTKPTFSFWHKHCPIYKRINLVYTNFMNYNSDPDKANPWLFLIWLIFAIYIFVYVYFNGCGCGGNTFYVEEPLQSDFNTAVSLLNTCDKLPQANKDKLNEMLPYLHVYTVDLIEPRDDGSIVCGRASEGLIVILKDTSGCGNRINLLAHELLHIGGLKHETQKESGFFYLTLYQCFLNYSKGE